MRHREEVAAEEKRRMAALEEARRRSDEAPRKAEADVEERRREERLIAALEASRRNEEMRKDDDRPRIADTPTDQERAAYVRRIQAVLKRSRCYDGDLTGRTDDAQNGLNRLVNSTNRIGRIGLRRIVLAKAKVGDFESWLRDANVVQVGWCPPVAKPEKLKIEARSGNATPAPASARRRPAEPQTPRDRYARPRSAPSHTSGERGLILGVGY